MLSSRSEPLPARLRLSPLPLLPARLSPAWRCCGPLSEPLGGWPNARPPRNTAYKALGRWAAVAPPARSPCGERPAPPHGRAAAVRGGSWRPFAQQQYLLPRLLLGPRPAWGMRLWFPLCAAFSAVSRVVLQPSGNVREIWGSVSGLGSTEKPKSVQVPKGWVALHLNRQNVSNRASQVCRVLCDLGGKKRQRTAFCTKMSLKIWYRLL